MYSSPFILQMTKLRFLEGKWFAMGQFYYIHHLSPLLFVFLAFCYFWEVDNTAFEGCLLCQKHLSYYLPQTRKKSCNCLPQITIDTRPTSLCISNFLSFLLAEYTRFLHGKQHHLVAIVLNFQLYRSLENLIRHGPLPLKSAQM